MTKILLETVFCMSAMAFATGCGSDRAARSGDGASGDPPSSPSAAQAAPAMSAETADSAEWFAINTAAGSYTVKISLPPQKFPVNEMFSLRTVVLDPNGRVLDGEIELAVDAAMPAHRHGMNVRPKVARSPDGSFTVRGLRLHMSGEWEMYFDVTRHGLTERATLPVTLP